MRHSRRARQRARLHTRRHQLLKRVVNDPHTVRDTCFDALVYRGRCYTARELFFHDLLFRPIFGVGRQVFRDEMPSRARRKKMRKLDPGRELHRRWFRQFEKRWEAAEDQRIFHELHRRNVRHTDNFIKVKRHG